MKCVVLGFGYLAQYLLPCIRRFTGGANADLIGVKATTTGLDALRAKYAFRVRPATRSRRFCSCGRS